jgi:uncharacterized protein YoxC
MNDGVARATPIEVRLAVLEENVRRIDSRLNTVSDRTHTLISEVQAVTLGIEEARDQRSNLIDKVDDIQTSVNSLSHANVKSVVEMSEHVKLCERRSARLEKLAWAAISALVAVLGALALPYLQLVHLH